MRVKLKDPRRHVRKFEYGRDYSLSFYGASGCMQFTHTRKKNVQLKSVASGNRVESIHTVSKRELKQLINDIDMVQWVVEIKQQIEGEKK